MGSERDPSGDEGGRAVAYSLENRSNPFLFSSSIHRSPSVHPPPRTLAYNDRLLLPSGGVAEAAGTPTQPPGRTLVKQSASPPPSALGPTTSGPLQSDAGSVLVERPASYPSRAPALVKAPVTPAQRAPVPVEASTSTTGGPSWLLLDRLIHRSRRHRGVFGGDATTSETSCDCAGRCIHVSLRIADPPQVSRMYLHWTVRPAIRDVLCPSIIVAHCQSILFKVTVPFEDPDWWHNSCSFPIDYFVYSATNTSSSSALPSLTRLPPCFDLVIKNKEDKLFQPYRRQQQRCMLDTDMGLLCHDDGGFTVADLTYRSHNEVELCMIHHSPCSYVIPMQWKIRKLSITSEMKFDPSFWMIDTVFPIDGCLCWVDYYKGMLLADVLLANGDSESSPDQQKQLRYIALPKLAMNSTRPYKDALSPDPFRHVCVTDAGIVKLVCIFTKRSQSTFTIITWSLNIHKGIWIKDCSTIIGDSEFFGLFDAAQKNLPRVRPSFPVVSLADPDIVCFLLKEYAEDHYTYWVIEVNMKEKVLQSTALYIRGEEEEGYSPEKPRWNFYGQYFVPSRFSSYLGQDDFKKSRELRVLMEEKSKQRHGMQTGAQFENLLTQKELQFKNLPKQKKSKRHRAKGRRHK